MTADPFGRAFNADLSVLSESLWTATRNQLTSLGIALVSLWEATERQVESLVDVSNVLLEVRLDLGELSTVGTGHDDPAG